MDDFLDQMNGTVSSGRPHRETSLFLGVLLFLLSVICVVGNVLTILAFRARESVQLRLRTSNLLILSLSCADLVIGLTGLPFAALTYSLGGWPLGETVCLMGAFFSVVGVAGGMYTLAAISADRMLLVSREYAAYLRLQSLRNVRLQIAGTWLLAVLVSASEAAIWAAGGARETEDIIDYTAECRSPVRTDLRFAFVAGFLLFVVPFVVMVVCSLRFVVLLRRRLCRPRAEIGVSPFAAAAAPARAENGPAQTAEPIALARPPAAAVSPAVETVDDAQQPGSSTRDSRAGAGAAAGAGRPSPPASPGAVAAGGSARSNKAQQANVKRMQKRYLKPAVRLAILLGVFAFCSLPYPIFVLVADTKCPDCQAQVTARNHLSNLLLANSALNPFLYAIMHRQIREHHTKRFRAIFCRRKRAL